MVDGIADISVMRPSRMETRNGRPAGPSRQSTFNHRPARSSSDSASSSLGSVSKISVIQESVGLSVGLSLGCIMIALSDGPSDKLDHGLPRYYCAAERSTG